MTTTSPGLGFWLAAARRRRGVTQAGLGRALGMSQPSISMIERGERNPGHELEEACLRFIQEAFPEAVIDSRCANRPDVMLFEHGGSQVFVEVKAKSANEVLGATDDLLLKTLATAPRGLLLRVLSESLPEIVEACIQANSATPGTGEPSMSVGEIGELRRLADRLTEAKLRHSAISQT